MRIGIFGGTFNPPHKGHLRAAEIFCESARLDLLLIIPAKVSPFKTNEQKSVSDGDRYAMTKLCFEELKETCKAKVKISRAELDRSGTSYTIDTVNEILEEYKENTLCLYMGSDMFLSFDKWKNCGELAKKCEIYTLARTSGEKQALSDCAKKYELLFGARVFVSALDEFCVSSTGIREDFASNGGANSRNLLTIGVFRYIIDNKLYSEKRETGVFTHEPTSVTTLEKIRASLGKFLTEKRLEHTLSVEKEALMLASAFFPAYGADLKYLSDVSAAALLHDITKKRGLTAQHELCEKYGVETDCVNANSVNLLHSKTAAFLARDEFAINDYVFNAIYRHTTGSQNMSVLDKIIFLADYTEPTRKHQACKNAREKLLSDMQDRGCTAAVLDGAVLSALDATVNHLIETRQPTDLETIKARNYLIAQYAEL